MNLQQLRYVLEVEKCNSITRAAKNLFMGQPNLSKAIKELELEIGITIFKRTPKGVKPTRDGEQFLRYARSILAQMDQLESFYKTHAEKALRFTLSVPRATYISTAFSQFLNSSLQKEQLDGKKFVVYYKETNAHTTIQDVVTGESDLGIIRYSNVHKDYFLSIIKEHGLAYECIGEFTKSVMLHKEHPLAHYEDIPFHALSHYIELLHGDFQEPTLSLQKASEPEMPQKRIYIYDRSSQFDLLREVYGTYLWVSPMPEEVLQRHDLVTRRCSLATPTTDMIIYPHKESLRPLEISFIQLLQQTLKQLK
ncbi:LysR family transcriptional regulator [Sporanaerobium hydrogeniformans]|uniref:LysR family transcriptional regulator n=1 Tax=Sporanaerobium hydrogeniformans TaxID=3072179 RepID=UPI0015D50886|nr:LysR family transcriptional regulator [Sporanaerobium hydrogeniformans]